MCERIKNLIDQWNNCTVAKDWTLEHDKTLEKGKTLENYEPLEHDRTLENYEPLEMSREQSYWPG